jgi:hypothetical protein
MPSYALLFKGGLPHSELTKVYSDRFTEWARKVAVTKAPMLKLKQEGRIVSATGIDDMKLNKDTVGGYIIVEAGNYDEAIAIAKDCPILENNGSVEIREIMILNS